MLFTDPKRRSGYTMVELMVVIAILMILFTLSFIPMLLKVRENAKTTQCLDNLRRLGTACVDHHNIYGYFPPSRDIASYAGEVRELLGPNWDEVDGDEALGPTWAVFLLPRLGYEDLFLLWNMNASASNGWWSLDYNNQPEKARKAIVPQYFCPTRRSPDDEPTCSITGDDAGAWATRRVNTTPGPSTKPGALGDYACCSGTTGDDIWNRAHPDPPNGVMRLGVGGRGLNVTQITDGTAYTIMLGEKHVQLNKFGHGNNDCSIYNGRNILCSMRCAGLLYPLAQSIEDTGWKFGSYHEGIVPFVMADTTVRKIPNSIDLLTLERLANIGDGQQIQGIE